MFAFRFVAIGPFLAQIWQILYLTLKNLGQGHDENGPKSNQVIYRSWPTRNPRSCWKFIAWTRICGRWCRRRRRRTNRYKNIKSTPVYRGDLIIARCSITQTPTGQSKVWWWHDRKMVVIYSKRIWIHCFIANFMVYELRSNSLTSMKPVFA